MASPILSLLDHPAALNIYLLGTIAFINGFTSPHSHLRLSVGLPVVTFLTVRLVSTSVERTGSRTLGGMFGAPPIGFWLQYVDTALIGKWHIEAEGPRILLGRKRTIPVTHDPSISSWSRFVFGLKSVTDIRGTNTFYESGGIPPFSSTNPKWIPSKRRFLIEALIKTVAAYVILAVLDSIPTFSAMATAMGTSNEIDLVGRLSKVTLTELLVRLLATCTQLANVALGMQLIFGAVSIPLVAMGFYGPADFRPVMGSPLEAYTIRRFWSPFWHQIWRRRFSSIAALITFDFLGLPRKSFHARYVNLLLVFWISSLLHLGEQVAHGEPWRNMGAITFFMSQAFAIMLEDFVSWIFGLRNKVPTLLMRLLGYLWVLSVLALTGPYWKHPALAD